MLEKADAILKLAISAAVMCAALAVSYYYVAFLPSQAAAATERAQAETKAREDEEKRKERQAQAAHDAAQSRYDACVSVATGNYSSRWNVSCSRQHDADLKAKNNCFATAYDKSFCDNYTVRPAAECALPGNEANTYGADLAHDKQMCLDQLKAGA